MPRERDRLRKGSVDRNIDRAMKDRDRGREAPDRSLRGESLLSKIGAGVGKLQSGAKTVAEKVGPVAQKVQAHARKVNAQQGRGGGGMGMDFGFTPFGGGLPSAPGFGGGFGPAQRAPRKSGGTKTTIRTGGKTITISSGGGTKKKKKGGGSGSVPPWHPDFRLPY
jgi:hypothetical protein